MFDLAALDGIEQVSAGIAQLRQRVALSRRIEYVFKSRSVTARAAGFIRFRCLGAGGGSTKYRGGNGGTVAFKTIPVKPGDTFVIVIPAGGAAPANNAEQGADGATLTVNGPGISMAVPGGKGAPTTASSGSGSFNVANLAPAGADWFLPGGRSFVTQNGTAEPGVAPVIFGFDMESGGAAARLTATWNAPALTHDDCLPLLMRGFEMPTIQGNQGWQLPQHIIDALSKLPERVFLGGSGMYQPYSSAPQIHATGFGGGGPLNNVSNKSLTGGAGLVTVEFLEELA